MSSIYIRKDKTGTKRYYGSLYIGKKRVRKYLGLTESEASNELKKLEYEYAFGINNPNHINLISFNDAIVMFKSVIDKSGISINQCNIINIKVNWFKDYCNSIGIIELNKVNRFHVKSYLQFRKATFPTSSTLNKEIGFIKRFFNHCIDMEWIISNPFRSIRNVRVDSNRQRYYFSDLDVKKIMDNAGEYHDFYSFLLNTGIRSTDAFNLSSEHLQGRYIVKKMNKTGDWLNIPLPENILGIIEARKHHEFIFHELQTSFKRRKCTNHMQATFEPDFVRKNNINLHTFRHTYAHNMLNKGVPKEVLQTLLGHRSIKTTEIYANWVRKEELERWV
jgi:site-specific recombinase XerD